VSLDREPGASIGCWIALLLYLFMVCLVALIVLGIIW